MSLRGASRSTSNVFYTPDHAVESLLDHGDDIGLFHSHAETWECAAGAGHVARVLRARGHKVLATDVKPAQKQVVPVAQLDFLQSHGPSYAARLNIITNPPYGFQSRLALAFLAHGFAIMERGRVGSIAFLLPFEFDAASRDHMVGGHPWFVGKLTLKTRIRWLNIPQKEHGPQGHHSWFLWSNELAVQKRARSRPMMVTK